MWRNYDKVSYIALGAALSGAVALCGALLANQRRHARKNAAEQRVKEEEEAGAIKAERVLLAASFYGELENLNIELEGEIILPTDREKYHGCRRRAFNQSQRGFPCVIARVKSRRDVVACIKFVNKYRKDLNLCVASGCHSSKCMMDYAFVIDLAYMNKVVLEQDNTVVKVEGGAYLEDIDKVLQPHNLGFTIGTYPLTGVGGLVLGGGYGFLARMFGFSVDNLLECEVVLHNGDVVVANDTQYSDLMWGLRGGGGNFGIVTKFIFKVHELPPHCLGGIIAHFTPTLGSTETVAQRFDKLASELPNNTSSLLLFLGGESITPTVWAHFGEEKYPSEVSILKKAEKLGGWMVLQNSVKEKSYHNDLQTLTTQVIKSGHVYLTVIQFGEIGKELPVEFWEKLLTLTRSKVHHSLEKASFGLFTMGGAVATSDPEGKFTCMTQSARKAKYFGIVEVYWKHEFGETGKESAREWARKVTEIIRPHSSEALRYAAADTSVGTADLIERDQLGYGQDRYPKLRAIKKKYDPTNLFINNLNITPAE